MPPPSYVVSGTVSWARTRSTPPGPGPAPSSSSPATTPRSSPCPTASPSSPTSRPPVSRTSPHRTVRRCPWRPSPVSTPRCTTSSSGGRRCSSATWAIAAAITPMCLFLGGTVNPQGLEVATAFSFWAACLALALGTGAPSTGTFVQVAVSGAVLVNVRASSPVWAVGAVAVALILAPPGRWREVLRQRSARWVGLAGALASTARDVRLLVRGRRGTRPARTGCPDINPPDPGPRRDHPRRARRTVRAPDPHRGGHRAHLAGPLRPAAGRGCPTRRGGPPGHRAGGSARPGASCRPAHPAALRGRARRGVLVGGAPLQRRPGRRTRHKGAPLVLAHRIPTGGGGVRAGRDGTRRHRVAGDPPRPGPGCRRRSPSSPARKHR